MSSIRIKATPTGKAPQWVREAWVGLELPLDPVTPIGNGQEIFTKTFRGVDFRVQSGEAFGRLRAERQGAFEWWQQNYSVKPNTCFCFDPGCAELIFSDQRIGDMTLGQFTDLVRKPNYDHRHTIWFEDAAECVGAIWQQLLTCPLTPTSAIWLAQILVARIRSDIDNASGELMYNRLLTSGHALLKRIQTLLGEHGLNTEGIQIDQPLSYTEEGVQAGYFEMTPSGLVKLTPKAEAEVEKIRQSL